MEKLKQSLFNILFYIVVIALIIITGTLVFFAVLKLNVYAAEEHPEKSMCIVIDAGHGGEDGGAQSADGVAEKGINLNIARYTRDFLVLSGYEVQMTREDNTPMGDTSLPTLAERRRSDFAERLKLFNSDNTDIAISIHQNKFTEPQYSGAQVFYSPNNAESGKLAECIRSSVTGLIQPQNKRQNKESGSEIYLLYNCKKPCVLVECGFLSNPDEAALLNTEEYQKQLAFAICCAVLDYTGGGRAPAGNYAVVHNKTEIS